MIMPRFMPSLRAALCLLSAVLPFACRAQTITVTSGNNQTTLLNSAFPKPLVVTVLDASGNPIPGLTVTFSGSGIVATTVVTDANGQASAVVTANSVLGGSTVSANATENQYLIPGGLVDVTTIFTLTNANAACVPYITVTSTGDADSGSLREALADVCAGGTVDLSRLSAPSTITLQSRLYIYQDVTILGPPTGTLTISGNYATRLFFIQAGNVAIENLTLANGYGKGGDSGGSSHDGSGGGAGMGGAIFQNGGNVALANVDFTGNQSVGGNGGVSNTSVGCGGFGTDATSFDCAGDLGGIGTGLPSGTNNTDNENFTDQQFSGGDGGAGGNGITLQFGAGFVGAGGPGGFGGGGGAGQYYYGGFVGNGGPGGFGGGSGGSLAEAVGGYGAGNGYSTAKFFFFPQAVDDGAFIGGGGAGFGGAIFERKGTLVLNSVRFLNNGSVAGTSISYLYGVFPGPTNYRPGQAKGGALFVYDGAIAILADVTFFGNSAPNAGQPGIGNSAAPYTNGATCPGNDDVNVCGHAPSISAPSNLTVQTTPPGTPFNSLSVTLNSGSGNPVSGANVTFKAPAAGASGLFVNSTNTITVQTNSSGTAIVPFAANSISGGPYTVTATANGLTEVFYLTNFSTAATVPFITGQTPGLIRTDSATVGLQFTVGSAPITVYALGRFAAPGDAGQHVVQLVQGNGTAVPNGSVTIATAGAAAGAYQYAPLASPILLLPNTSYFLMSQEGSDPWFNYGPVASTSIATVVAPVYVDAHGNYVPVTSLPGQAYVPLNFLAQSPAEPISVTITAPYTNDTLAGNVSVIAATAGPVAILHLQVDNVDQGIAVPVNANQTSYTLNLNTSILTTGTHSITVIATGANSETVTSAPVPVYFNNTPGTSAAAFVLGQTLGPIRNNYTGFVGMSLTVGSTAITVTSLGRYVAPGDYATHLLKLVSANGTDLPGASVSISLLGAAPGAFQYAALPTPITIQPNTSYYLVSQETAGVDQWYDLAPITTTAAAQVTGPTYTDGHGNYVTVPGLESYSYVPVSFLYGSANTAALSATITSPQSGAHLSGNFPVTVATTGAVTSLQLQVDGVDVGAPAPSNSLTLDTAILGNGPHTLTVVAANGTTATATSPGVNVTISNPLTTFTSAQTPAVLRNNYSGYVGMAIQVGATPISVASLGRFVVAGNNGAHILKLVQADGNDLPGGSVTVTLGAGNTPGQYLYGSLPAPVALAANTTYYLVSQETADGDEWYNLAPMTTTSAAQVTGATYTDGHGNYVTVQGLPGYSYVPLSFQYR